MYFSDLAFLAHHSFRVTFLTNCDQVRDRISTFFFCLLQINTQTRALSSFSLKNKLSRLDVETTTFIYLVFSFNKNNISGKHKFVPMTLDLGSGIKRDRNAKKKVIAARKLTDCTKFTIQINCNKKR